MTCSWWKSKTPRVRQALDREHGVQSITWVTWADWNPSCWKRQFQTPLYPLPRSTGTLHTPLSGSPTLGKTEVRPEVSSWRIYWIGWKGSRLRIADSFYLFIYLFLLFIWLCWVLVSARRIFSCRMWDLLPWPGPPALGVWSLSHWTTREVPSW